MGKVVTILSIWLHLLATVVWLGYMFAGGVIIMPALGAEVRGATLGRVVERMRKRFLPWFWASVVVFAITGVRTLLAHPKYGAVVSFGSASSVVILVKHILVLALIGLGVYQGYFAMPALERLLSGMPAPPGGGQGPPPGGPPVGPPPALVAARSRLQYIGTAGIICALLILLLTAIAEVA